MVNEKRVRESLKKVIDPELGVNIVDLGLIYGIKVSGKKVKIRMTLTNPMCPLASMFHKMIEDELMKIKGIEEVKIDLVWEPAWTPEKMSEEVRMELGMI